jgi:hypothetical protein
MLFALVCLLLLARNGDMPFGYMRTPADTTEVDSVFQPSLSSWRLTMERLLDIDPEDLSESYVESYADFLGDVSGIEDSSRLGTSFFHLGLRKKLAEVLYAFGQNTKMEEEDQAFRGSPGRWYGRMYASLSEKISCAVSAGKDAGERADLGFLSGFVRCTDFPPGSEFIFGDFVVDAGCGLVSSADPNGGGRVTLARRLNRSPLVIRPYQYRNEFSFLRGMGWTLSLGPSLPVRLCAFISRRSLTGRSVGSGFALATTGLFRTEGEISRRGAIRETLVGGRLEFMAASQNVFGLTMSHAEFNPSLAAASLGQPEHRAALVGVDARINFGKISLSAEAARSENGGTAFVAVGSLEDGQITILLDGRSYARDFQNHRFGGPGSGTGANETGFGLDCRLQIAEWCTARSAVGEEWTPWHTDGIKSRKGKWWLAIGGDFRLLRTFDVTFEFRRKQTEEDLSAEESGQGTLRRADVTKDRIGVSGRLALGRKAELVTRADLLWRSVHADQRGDWGEVVRMELSCRPVSWCSLEGCIHLFSSSSYSAQIYVLADDPISTQRWRALNGDGTRWGIVARARPGQGMTASLYWAFEETRRRQPFVPVQRDRLLGFRLTWGLYSEAD